MARTMPAQDGGPGGARLPLRVNLALQGGGSHGAFAWGVLDRLLQEEDLEIPAIVGTSAGAMNATLLAAGLAGGGRALARDLLRTFWTRLPGLHPARQLWPALASPGWGWPGAFLPSWPAWALAETWSRLLSPYLTNPLGLNPLRDLLAEIVDFDVLRAGDTQLFLCATNVLTGKIRVFATPEIGPEHAMASACLPTLFQAVRIGDEHFWDGGYMGNPPIFPVIYNTTCPDVLIVQINPFAIDRVPRSPQEIADRINTLSFNSSLQREMRAIEFVSRLVDEGVLDAARFRRMNIHVVEAEATMRGLGVHSKFETDPRFLADLHALGRGRMEEWLAAHREDVGRRSSVDVASAFL